MSMNRLVAVLSMVAAVGLLSWWASSSRAYVEAPMSLGSVLAQSTNVVLMRVELVDKEKNLIVYRKVQDIKGKHNTDVIKHNIGRGGLRPNEWKPQMDWAEPGKMAVFFHNGGASETCIGNWWYQAYAGGAWWNHSHGKPDIALVGGGRVVLLQNNGEALSEVSLPLRYGARAAVWADYNGDGKPDLLLATPAGPKLLTNLGGSFRDDTHLLPVEPYYNL